MEIRKTNVIFKLQYEKIAEFGVENESTIGLRNLFRKLKKNISKSFLKMDSRFRGNDI